MQELSSNRTHGHAVSIDDVATMNLAHSTILAESCSTHHHAWRQIHSIRRSSVVTAER